MKELRNCGHDFLEFHDAIIEKINVQSKNILLRLQLCHHRRAGRLPGEPETCWIQCVEIELIGSVKWDIEIPLPAKVWDGSLTIGEQSFINEIPLPLPVGEPVKLTMSLINGQEINLGSDKIKMTFIGQGTYLEDFPSEK